ncbi:MAG: IS66 family transposase [Sulfitobacter sp.]|nr:IS66 family transposase [Sulfitobacter sp.]
MSDAAASLPTTLAECHARFQEQQAVIDAQQATIDTQQATIDTQQATIDTQQATIDTQQATIEEQQEQLAKLQRDIALMKRTLFGQRRERFDDPRQGMLFESAEVDGPIPDGDASDDDASGDDSRDGNVSDDAEASTPKRPKGRRRRVIPEGLPRTRRVHELKDSEIPEDLRGKDVRRFQKKVGEYVEWEPGRLLVVEEYVETLAADNEDATETTMISAVRPPRIITSFAGPGLLAGLSVHHFADHLPYYRLEEILTRSGLEIDRSTQCRWMIRLAEQLTPLTDLMRYLALQSSVVLADETPVKMLVPGQGKTKTTYLWAVLGDERYPYTTFSFTENRSRAGPAEFFANFSGVLLTDAYIGYEFLAPYTDGRIRLAGCYAHARRKFEELHVLGATKATSKAMGYFRRLFDIEDELRELSDEQRHEQRQRHSRPLVAQFKAWMDEQLQTLRPKHELRGAINYMTSRWECFERFLESGAIPLDNNASEQAVKNPVMGKKAWMFFGSEAGGNAASVFYTLTSTCRRLKIDPYAYLKDVFERLPLCDPQAPTSLTPLLPDHWLAAHPESLIQARVNESKQKAARKRADRTRRRKALARAHTNRG